MNDGISHFKGIQAPFFIGAPILTQGNVWFVRPETGSDTNSGKSPALAFATLAAAQAAATAGQNDIVYLMAESNTASATTDYQSTTLLWAKDLVHLVGVNCGPLYSQRSRVAFISTYVTASNLFTLSANGCLIQGVEFFAGVASANPTGCVSVSGERNVFRNCHIAGMGNASMDIAGAYSLQLNGAQECLFEDCSIGQDTVQLGAGATNSVLLFSFNVQGCTRNWFRNCRFLLNTSSATACFFLVSGATAMDRETVFEDCLFLNCLKSGSTTLTHAFQVAAGTSPAGLVVLTGAKTGLIGASGWNTVSAAIFATGGPVPVNTTYGTSVAITS